MVRRLIILVVGLTVVLIGMALLVLPGPAVIVIPAGLAILATEFIWARKLLNKMKSEAARLGSKLTGRSQPAEVKKEDDENGR